MSKDESRITNNPQIMQNISEQAKKATQSNDTNKDATINKIDEMVTILQSGGKERAQGEKSHLHGNDEDYDNAVKQ
jgi:hypothetical protein